MKTSITTQRNQVIITPKKKYTQLSVNKVGVSHLWSFAILHFKKVSYGKRRIMKTQIFSACKNIIIFKKIPSKRNPNPSRYYYNSYYYN
jgi:hypothetical protein